MGIILDSIRRYLKDTPPPEVGTSVTRGRTGRVTDSFTPEQQFCEGLVNDWLGGNIGESSDWGRRLVQELIGELPRCGAPSSYRARLFRGGEVPTDPLQFGPSPSRAAGRYNQVSQPALYLGTSLAGLALEMEQYSEVGSNFYVARYAPIEALELVDLSAPNIHSALHHAFDRAERPTNDYEPGQLLAEVVRDLGIDGMIVPGVRGTIATRYTNVVVFRNQEWVSWIDSTYLPAKL